MSNHNRNRFTRLALESLEGRLNPSWTIAPATIVIPTDLTALVFDAKQAMSGTAVNSSDEVDWYKVSPAWSASYQFNAAKSGSRIDTIMALYSSNGTLIAENDDISSSNTNSRFGTPLVAGEKYFLGVTNYTGSATGKYSLAVGGQLVDDAYENNDTLAAAKSIANSQTMKGLVMADAADYFKFTTTATTNSTALASIGFTSSMGDLDLKLVNSRGTLVKSGVQGATGETLDLGNLAAGTYCLVVTGKTGAYNAAYDLKLLATTVDAAPPPPAGAKSDWTIAVYMTATDLAEFGAEDVNEMEKAVSALPGTVKIAILYDQWTSQKFATGGGTQAAWGDTGRAIITADTNLSRIQTTFERIGEKNTGDPKVLTDFLSWTVTAAPANKYAVVLWNHGNGLGGSNYDDESNDNLTMSEIASAVKNSTMKPDLVSFDACLMGMVEDVYALRDIAKVYASSQELEAGTGQDYTTLFNVLKTNPGSVDAFGLGKGMVQSYQTQYVGTGVNEDTYSVVDTSKLGDLITALNQFSTSVTTANFGILRAAIQASTTYGDGSYPSYHDLGQIARTVAIRATGGLQAAANAVIDALDQAVFARTTDNRGSFGLSIYTPLSQAQTDAAYADHAGFATATGWSGIISRLLA